MELFSKRIDLFTSATAILLIVTSAGLLLADAPHLHDFSEWLYQAQIVRFLLEGSNLVTHFEFTPYPVPYSLSIALLAGLSFLIPPLWAGKIYLVLSLCAWFVVLRLFTKRYANESSQGQYLLVLFALVGLTSFFWYGFISYQLGLMFLTWFLSINDDKSSALMVCLFSLIIFFSHAMLFMTFVLLISIRLLTVRFDFRVVLALVPSGLLSAWYIVGRLIYGYEGPRPGAEWSGLWESLVYKAGYPAMLGPFRNFLQADGSSLLEGLPWMYWAGFVTNFGVALILGTATAWILWRAWCPVTAHRVEPDSQMRWFVTLLAMAYVLAPYNFYGLFNPGGRLLLPLILAVLILGRRDVQKPMQYLAWPVGILALVSSLSYSYLVITTPASAIDKRAGLPKGKPPSGSVLAYNDWIYRNTRYRFFNYRVLAMTDQLRKIEENRYPRLGFDIGFVRQKQSQ